MTLDVRAKFEENTMPEPNSGCYLWIGGVTWSGYGYAYENKKQILAHRLAWRLAGRVVPDGLCLDHICRVRSCVNVDHLRLLTPIQNVMIGEGFGAKNAAKTHCSNGHEFTGENTILAKNGRWRECRICKNARERRYHAAERREAV